MYVTYNKYIKWFFKHIHSSHFEPLVVHKFEYFLIFYEHLKNTVKVRTFLKKKPKNIEFFFLF